MNRFINETTHQALATLTISQEEYDTIAQLLSAESLEQQEAALAKRVLYGVRRGILELV